MPSRRATHKYFPPRPSTPQLDRHPAREAGRMQDALELIFLLRGRGRVFIQTHDFPDHDTVASAFGLQQLLAARDIDSRIIYEGDIQRESLSAMIQALGIRMSRGGRCRMSPRDRTVIVDGCKGNRNVRHLVAREVGIVDHHLASHPEDVPYVDIRPGYGACATIIWDYFRQLRLPVPRAVATALLIGIGVDTAQLTRGAAEEDFAAYTDLYHVADMRLVNSVIGGSVQQKDLVFYRSALDNVVIRHRFAFCYLPEGCSQNLLGILADFFMSLRGVDFVALCARNDGEVDFSIRCEREKWNASQVIQEVLHGLGLGGGHRHMAGGSIKELERFDVDVVYGRFGRALRIPARRLGLAAMPSRRSCDRNGRG
jgi:nanoRNase/pAp phosphatase (c-di-AMP/oligoRNAs hydrolase)